MRTHGVVPCVATRELGEYGIDRQGQLCSRLYPDHSVTISSGVASTSAFPALFPFRVRIAVLMVLLIVLLNLRGVKESGTVIAIPSYFFVLTMLVTIGAGFWRYFTGTLGTVVSPPEIELIGAAQPLTFLLLLRAFSNGTSAVTGVEAFQRITAFKKPPAVTPITWLDAWILCIPAGITFWLFR